MSHAHGDDGVADIENTLRILVATDLHVGYKERHPVQSEDSFLALENVLQIAKAEKVHRAL